MSFEIDTASMQQYTTNIQLLLQQKGSALQRAVSQGRYKGKAAKAVEQIGAVSARRMDVRHQDTPLQSTKHDARWVFPNDYIWADLIDDEDKLRSIIDPTSSYALNGTYALGRAIDDEIIEAFFARAKTGENGTTNAIFPDENYVRDLPGTPSTGLTVDKLRQAKRLLRMHEVDMDHDQVYCAITAQQEQDLLKETLVTSRDYTSKLVLEDGKISRFMGIEFVHIQRLPVTAAGIRTCPIWSKSGMHLGLWNDVSVSIDKRADKRNATQIMVKGTFGATRTEEGKVLGIRCKE